MDIEDSTLSLIQICILDLYFSSFFKIYSFMISVLDVLFFVAECVRFWRTAHTACRCDIVFVVECVRFWCMAHVVQRCS